MIKPKHGRETETRDYFKFLQERVNHAVKTQDIGREARMLS